jgi:hypothetical protein
MPFDVVAQHLLALACSRVSLATEFAGSGRPTVIEEAREERVKEVAEDDLGTTGRCY